MEGMVWGRMMPASIYIFMGSIVAIPDRESDGWECGIEPMSL
jgi:hypothetical protein